MGKFLRNLRLWILGFWHQERMQEVVEGVAATVPAPAVKASDRGKDIEETGRWYFKRDILDRLGQYFPVLAMMKKSDPDAYDLFSRVGGVITCGNVGIPNPEFNGWRARKEIGFGAVFQFRRDDKECALNSSPSRRYMDESKADPDKFYPAFVYFKKVDNPPATVQLDCGCVYEVTALYRLKKENYPSPIFVSVRDDGSIVLLKELKTIFQQLPKSQKSIAHRRWVYPGWLRAAAEENKFSEDRLAKLLFAWAYDVYQAASMDVRVGVKKGGIMAAFSVDLLRIPYFFNDREKIKVNGKTKKIFHIVRTHARITENRRSMVRSHFRGLRKFTWNGYSVNITMPGKHHSDLLDFDAGVHFTDAAKPTRGKMLVMGEAAKKIAHGLNA